MLWNRFCSNWPLVLPQMWITRASCKSGKYERLRFILHCCLSLLAGRYIITHNTYYYFFLSFKRCELCPNKDGGLKRTDTNSWAHVVCALYIPEVSSNKTIYVRLLTLLIWTLSPTAILWIIFNYNIRFDLATFLLWNQLYLVLFHKNAI